MSEYRVNPDMLKEHFISLQFGSTTFEQEFKDLPVSIRSNLTKLYNQYYKSSVQKIKKKKSESAEQEQFDPETQEQQELEELSEESDIEVKPVHKRVKKKTASNKRK